MPSSASRKRRNQRRRREARAAELLESIQQSVDSLAAIVGRRRRRAEPVEEAEVVADSPDEDATPVKSVVNVIRPPPAKKPKRAGDLRQRLNPQEPSTSSSVAASSSYSIPDARNRLDRRLGHVPEYQLQRQFRRDAAINASILPIVGSSLPAPPTSFPASSSHASGQIAQPTGKGKLSLGTAAKGRKRAPVHHQDDGGPPAPRARSEWSDLVQQNVAALAATPLAPTPSTSAAPSSLPSAISPALPPMDILEQMPAEELDRMRRQKEEEAATCIRVAVKRFKWQQERRGRIETAIASIIPRNQPIPEEDLRDRAIQSYEGHMVAGVRAGQEAERRRIARSGWDHPATQRDPPVGALNSAPRHPSAARLGSVITDRDQIEFIQNARQIAGYARAPANRAVEVNLRSLFNESELSMMETSMAPPQSSSTPRRQQEEVTPPRRVTRQATAERSFDDRD